MILTCNLCVESWGLCCNCCHDGTQNDKLVVLCNDGNYYCNVTNFDWSKKAARDLWTEHVRNATLTGHVDGIFGDHASSMLTPPDAPMLCNGAGANRSCWEFTPEFAAEFNAGHSWLVNYTQNMLAPLGGPVIDGPYGQYNVDVCSFPDFQQHVHAAQAGQYVIEASKGGCNPDRSCLASYLLAATEYTYLSCLADEPTLPYYPDMGRPLGAPMGDATQGPDGVWVRHFASGTTARWYPNASQGTVQFPGEPMPPVPPAVNVSSSCGRVQMDTTLVGDRVMPSVTMASAQECCNACVKVPPTNPGGKCTAWAWHEESEKCFLFGNQAVSKFQSGTISAWLPEP